MSKIPLTSARRIAALMQEIHQLTPAAATQERYEEVCLRITSIPLKDRPASLVGKIAQVFGRTTSDVNRLLRTKQRQEEFDNLVPSSGWLHDYVMWTGTTEPPTVFHFFVGAVAVGGSLGRNVFVDKGAYQVFPNLCVMLIAPTGRCRKTSAANLGTRLYSKAGGHLIADKATPEALVDSLTESAVACIYAPELAVFLGKQKYQEGMIPLLTSLFDSPEEWTTKTIGRGSMTLKNVAVSSIMCSTVDWLQTSVPADVFSGGFMSRFLFVVQESTPRSFSMPPPLDADMRKDLIKRLIAFRLQRGQMELTPEAFKWYDHWYNTRGGGSSGDKHFAGYFQRKPDHMLRLAMILRASYGHKGAQIEREDLELAERILLWLEEWLPGTFDQLSGSTVGEDQARILRQLKQHNGSMEHSSLLRLNSARMNAEQFRRAVATLREARLVEFDDHSRKYFLTPEGWI